MYEAVQFRGWLGLLLTLQFQSALITLQGSSQIFQHPGCTLTSVLDTTACYDENLRLDHTVLVIGYDLTNPAQPYWVIRNSWGEGWCLKGYMRIGVRGGDGVCGMNVLPAFYPVPAPVPGDWCYNSSTVSSGSPSRAGVLNPCGGGLCTPKKDGYTCTCPGGFVAVDINITTTMHGLKSAQSCVPVDACRLSLRNPCNVGTCINDEKGGYSCICPLRYQRAALVDGKPTCKFIGDRQGILQYILEAQVTCEDVAATYNLTLGALQQQNPRLNCSSLTVGFPINVTNPAYHCSIGYRTTSRDKTCRDLLVNTGLGFGKDVKMQEDDLRRLNTGLDCDAVRKGRLVCLRSGDWENLGSCTDARFLGPGADCSSAALKLFPEDPALFYKFNQDFDCQSLTKSDGLNPDVASRGEKVCKGRSPPGVTMCPNNAWSYVLKNGDNCVTLRGKFRNYAWIVTLNPGFRCGSCIAGSTICYPRWWGVIK